MNKFMVKLIAESILRRNIMAKKATEKKPLFGNARSHAMNATRRKQNVNLQKVTVNGKTVRVSARELRTLKKMATSNTQAEA